MFPMGKYQVNNTYDPHDDSIVRTLRKFGLSHTHIDPKKDIYIVSDYDKMRQEFLLNGSEPIDIEDETTNLKGIKMSYTEQLSPDPHKQYMTHISIGSPTCFKKSLFDIKKRERTKSDRTRSISQSVIENRCVFCSNNNEPPEVVKSHTVRDMFGRVLCPKLRTYVCPICSSSGDLAHTVKYCPKKPVITMEDANMLETLKCNDILRKYEKFR